jgi:hypothetical protein
LIDWEIVDSIQEEDGSGRKKIWKEMMNWPPVIVNPSAVLK